MNLHQEFIAAFGEFLESFGQAHGVIVGLRHPKYVMEALTAREIDADAVSFIPVFQPRPSELPAETPTPESDNSDSPLVEVIESPPARHSASNRSKKPKEG